MVGAAVLTAWELGDFGEPERSVTLDLNDEASLARAAAQGGRRAFARLVGLHQRAVYGLCLRVLREPEEARDAAQESFVRAWAALASYDPAQPFAPWVLRIARNHCIDQVRRRLPAARTVELDAPPLEGAERPELADQAASADVLLATAEGARAVGAAVATLPENYRQVIHLFHVEHLSYKEIAVTMEVPIGTVMTWLYRARAKLRAALTQQEERS